MKGKRQEAVLQLIEKNIILTQDDLQRALTDMGFRVTQSTVSRDIKELRLIKGHDQEGNYRYIAAKSSSNDLKPKTHYMDMFSSSVKSIDYALNNIVIKCYNGMASSVCVAVDAMYGERMLGSIAGDDTVLIIVDSEVSAKGLTLELKKLK